MNFIKYVLLFPVITIFPGLESGLASQFHTQSIDEPDIIINNSITNTGPFFYNVNDLGASGNGVEDDSGPIQSALTAAGGSSHGVVYLPEGTYLLEEPVIWARLSGERNLTGIRIKGDGIGKTIVIVDNEQGGFILDDFYNQTQFQVSDLTILAARPGAGTALAVGKDGNRMGARGYRCFTGENILIRGRTASDYFIRGVDVVSLYRPLCRNITVTGPQGDGEEFNTSVGIATDYCYSPEVEDCKVNNAAIGFSYVPRGDHPEGPEAGTFHRCVADNCGIGIDIDQPINEPGLAISYCTLRTRETGIRLSRKKFYQVRNNVFEPLVDPATNEYKDISTLGSFMGVYHRNIFMKYKEGGSTEDLRTCISFDESGWVHNNKQMIVMHNVFPESGTDVGGDEYDILEDCLIKDNMHADSLEAGTIQKVMYEDYFEPVHPGEMEITGPVFSVLDYGAGGNDWVDDAGAFQDAVDAWTSNGEGILYIPAGQYLVDNMIVAEIYSGATEGAMAIHGEGPGVSRVICNNNKGAFKWTDHSGKIALDLQNFGIYANKNHATAIHLESGGVALQDYRTLKIRNVDIQPYEETFSAHIHFSNGLVARGFSKPYFYNYVFNSHADPRYTMPANEMTRYGVYLEDCDNMTFIYCYVWKTKYAYYIKSETCNNSFFYRTRGVGGFNGIYMVMDKPSKGLWIEACHQNKTLSNIYLENMTDFVLIDNLPYGPADENKLNDIEMVNCRDGLIIGNVFQAPVIENYQPEPKSSRNAVSIRGDRSANIVMEMNIYNAKGRALLMDEGIEGVIARDNLYPNPQVIKAGK